MSNPNSNIIQTVNPDIDHRILNARLPAEVTVCDDCGTPRAIDGDVPVDLFVLDVPVKDQPTFYLCLGDLASRRMLGQDISRVKAVG